ncbi:hypothetical protein B0H13DRAFT_1591852, partial [Mycena leptocephala]
RAEVVDDTSHPNVEAAFEVPGVLPSDLRIYLKHGILIIQGQRLPRHSAACGRHAPVAPPPTPITPKTRIIPQKIQEFHYGRFYRALRLPSDTRASLCSSIGA